jgi:uncharacterized protein YndB with AHSA1/START domain
MRSETEVSGNRLRITRLFHAPRHTVFAWWTTPEKLQQWSGCKEMTQCEIQMDFRVGGSFVQKMKIAANGGLCDFTVTGTYDEIIQPERIVYRANLGPMPARVTVEFSEEGRATKVVLTHEGLPNDFICKTVSQGTHESLDKLDSLMAGQAVANSLS